MTTFHAISMLLIYSIVECIKYSIYKIEEKRLKEYINIYLVLIRVRILYLSLLIKQCSEHVFDYGVVEKACSVAQNFTK